MSTSSRDIEQQNKALKEENEGLKEENKMLESEKEAALQREKVAVEKCQELEERKTRVRKLSEEHYNTTQQLDHALQAVLDKEGVEFKRELKKEI